MPIKQSVGRGGVNDKTDAKLVQILLNLNLDKLPDTPRLDIDGIFGPKSLATIDGYQTSVAGMNTPDGRIDPGGRTLRSLQSGMPDGLNADKLHGIMIHAPASRVEKYAEAIGRVMLENGIDTPLRQAHFLAQIGHESSSLRYTEEIASGEAYEGRGDLGNTEEGDGVKFKGRGFIQLTGRANYTEYGDDIGQDLISDENYKRVAEEADLAVGVSCWFWNKRKLNNYADEDDVRAVTKRINGGYNGLDDRIEYLDRAKFFLMPPA